jgi:hypothetical protein
MLAHFLGVLALIGSVLLLVFGLGVAVFGLARGDRRLARRAALGIGGLVVAYLLGVVLSGALAPTRVLPIGEELSFCGFDCHLHVSVVGSESEENQVGVTVKVRSDARREPEYPRYLQFRLLGSDGTVLAPFRDGQWFTEPLDAGQEKVEKLYFIRSTEAFPYSLQVIYPDLPEALLLGPANSRAVGKTTLSIGQ